MLLDAFIKFEQPAVAGESTDTVHTGEIEILSFEQTITRSEPTIGATTPKSKAEHAPLTLIKPLDKSSPKLFEAMCKGTLYKQVTISLCQPSGTTKTSSSSWKKIVYLEIVLEQVQLARVHLMGDPKLHHFGRAQAMPLLGGPAYDFGPLEEIDLSYQKITWNYKGGSGTTNISGSWSLLTNSTS